MVLSSRFFYTALGNTAYVTVLGTVVGMSASVGAAYALSEKKLPGRRFLTLAFLFTMVFNGGMIPTYLLIQKLGLLNSLWAVIFSGAGSVYNILIVKTYFENLPESLTEAARIDGASRLCILSEFFSVLYY
jgi:putative aldouronate transport system permease protein